MTSFWYGLQAAGPVKPIFPDGHLAPSGLETTSPGCHRPRGTWSSAVAPPPPHPGQCAAFKITCPHYLEHADIRHSHEAASSLAAITAGNPEASVTNGQGHWGNHHIIRARTAKDNVRHLGLLSLFEYSNIHIWICVPEVMWSENSPSHWKNKCIFMIIREKEEVFKK